VGEEYSPEDEEDMAFATVASVASIPRGRFRTEGTILPRLEVGYYRYWTASMQISSRRLQSPMSRAQAMTVTLKYLHLSVDETISGAIGPIGITKDG